MLTNDELRVAIAAAKRYPKGRGVFYLDDLDYDCPKSTAEFIETNHENYQHTCEHG